MTQDQQRALAAKRSKEMQEQTKRMNAAYGGWMPIATAPKDGADVLLLSEEGVYQGYWCGGKRPGFSALVLDVHGCGCCGGSDPTPSHWMPLPPPPSDTGAETP